MRVAAREKRANAACTQGERCVGNEKKDLTSLMVPHLLRSLNDQLNENLVSVI
jgi:hypothetical protein